MPIKPLQDYSADDMLVPEFRADATAQLVAAILALNASASRDMQGLASALSAYDSLRQHPAYAHLSAEHHAREVAAAHEMYAALGSVQQAAAATLQDVDPGAAV